MGFAIEDLLTGGKFAPRSGGTHEVRFLPDPEPRQRWASIISVDDHVVEPPEIFEGRFPKKFAEQAPRIVDTDNGGQAWLWNGQVLPNVGFNAVAAGPAPPAACAIRPNGFTIASRNGNAIATPEAFKKLRRDIVFRREVNGP